MDISFQIVDKAPSCEGALSTVWSAVGAFLLLMFFVHNNDSNLKDNWRKQEDK